MQREIDHMLGRRVVVERYVGGDFKGKLIGYCPEPALVVEDENGHRLVIGRSAVSGMWEDTNA